MKNIEVSVLCLDNVSILLSNDWVTFLEEAILPTHFLPPPMLIGASVVILMVIVKTYRTCWSVAVTPIGTCYQCCVDLGLCSSPALVLHVCHFWDSIFIHLLVFKIQLSTRHSGGCVGAIFPELFWASALAAGDSTAHTAHPLLLRT